MTEVWKRISIFPAYEVSNTGKVRKGDRLLIIGKTQDGYPRVTVRDANNRWHHKAVHAIVCEVFNGPKPTPKHETAHADGTKTNNHPSNLRWATRKENSADKFNHGTSSRGEGNARAKITEKQVLEARKRFKDGVKIDILMKDYGLSRSQMYKSISGMHWPLIGHTDETNNG